MAATKKERTVGMPWQKNRREFLKSMALGCAGGIVLPWACRKADSQVDGNQLGLGRSQGTAQLPNQPFVEPQELQNVSSVPGVFEASLEVGVTAVNVAGTMVNLLTYNGQYPGPTIRIAAGDSLRIHFRNNLPPTNERNVLGFARGVTNLHTHGLHVSPAGASDNIFHHFAPGEEFTFEYDTSLHRAGNLNWYHPHVHGLVAEQIWGGLHGALVVEDAVHALEPFATRLMVLKDLSIAGSEPEPYSISDYQTGKRGVLDLVNGVKNPVLAIRPDQIQRWRVLNASTAAYYRLSLDGHPLHLVGTDSNLLDRPYALDELLLAPGERADLLVHATEGPGDYTLRCLSYDAGCGPSTSRPLLTMSCAGPASNDQLPLMVDPNASRIGVDTRGLQQRSMTLSMHMGRATINGHDFDTDPYTLESPVGEYEVWTIQNMSPMDHPFHQHVNPAQVMSVGGGHMNAGSSPYTSVPGLKDTINIPRMARVELLVPVRDFVGRTVFHCHIVEHEDIGMMGIWELT
jgi:FtsP/CotA-like multicopper oxidase with cupredoxin domain